MKPIFLFTVLFSLLGVGVVGTQETPDDTPQTESEETQSPVSPPAIPPPGRPPERRMVPLRPPSSNMVSLNFNRADLVEVIHVLAQHLKLNYTIDPEVKGTVTIYSAEPLRTEDLLPIFHQILRINGAVAVKTGDLYRIALIKDGKGIARPLGQGKEDSYAIQVVPVRFFSVAEMKRLLTPFVTPGGEILDYPRGNFLIIVDLPSNIQRLMEIKDLMDVNAFAGTRMELYQPKVASAEDLATEMTKVMQAYASSTAQTEGFAAQFIPIPRINQLLVISHSEGAWTYVQRWLEKIDTLGEGPGRRIFIYPVENGKAIDLADVLNQVLGLAATAKREPGRTLQDLHRGLPTGQMGTGTGRSQLPSLYGTSPSTSPSPTGSAFAVTPAPPPAPASVSPPPAQAAPQRPGQPVARTEEQLRIVPDPATNSLIIYGTAQEFQNIKTILKDLDQIPRQVLLDCLVAEVRLTDDLAFGIEYALRRRNSAASVDPALVGKGSLLGTLPENFPTGLTAIIASGNDYRVIINALMDDSRVKVLSSPSILATDNRPARIQVGTEEPIPTGTLASPTSGGDIVSSTTVQYRNTGRILTIIPQVNSLGLVHLQIKAEVSQRGENVLVGQDSFPSFDTRDAETTAVVQNGETLVLGGIITENKGRSRRGIPYLMDIPVIGRFFGLTTDEMGRTELIMLITPRVIDGVQDARDATREFKQRLSTVAREVERMKKEEQKATPTPERPLVPVPEKSSQSFPSDRSSLSQPGRGSVSPEVTGESQTKVRQPIKFLANGSETTSTLFSEKKEQAGALERQVEPAGRKWTVQVAAFPDEPSALQMAQRFQEQGYGSYVVRANIKGQVWYRVRVGQFATEGQAKELLGVLQTREGFAGAFAAYQ